MPAKKKIYLVTRRASATYYGLFVGVNTSSCEPVMACDTEEKAIGEARQLEKEARKVLPPFYAGQPEQWSNLWPQGLIFELEKLGLRDLPDPNIPQWQAAEHWQRWWDHHGGELSPEQIEAIWALFDRVEFYSIVSVPVKG